MQWVEYSGEASLPASAAWVLVYATVDAPLADVLAVAKQRLGATSVFGSTSFQGVFCRDGFRSGVHLLFADPADGVVAAPSLKTWPVEATANIVRRLATEAVREMQQRLGGAPTVILMHATPGFEESILDGIDDGFDGRAPPVYGGSAADNDLTGEWRVFLDGQIEQRGALLVGLRTKRDISGAFVSGYQPTDHRGVITRAEGRVVHEIDGEPAALVYNRWTWGKLDPFIARGGVVLGATTLHPVGRAIDRLHGVERYVLSHPQAVLDGGALAFFTDMAKGDEITLMTSKPEVLLERTQEVVARALGSRGNSREPLRGAILTYCGGCVSAIANRTDDVSRLFGESIGNAPFIGAATWGEQGCFHGPRNVNVHGNLMCNAILFK